MNLQSAIKEIEDALGTSSLICGDAVKQRASSWKDSSPCQAAAIVRPASTQDVSQVMRICNRLNCSVVPFGGLTGLVDGAHATETDIALSLERLQDIEIDTSGRTATVGAGVLLQTLEEVVNEEELTLPVDLGSRGSAMIGGMISTNAGGNRVIRYGMMREQILGLEAVLSDGTIVSSMNALMKNNTGYDLKQLFIGSEGTLGIITRAVLRLRPKARSHNTAFLAAKSFKQVSDLQKKLDAELGGRLSAFEVMWNDFYNTVINGKRHHNKPLPESYPYYILVESLGARQISDQEEFEMILSEAFDENLYEDAVIAQSHSQRSAMWDIRDDIDTIFEAFSPLLNFDVSLPIKHIPEYLEDITSSLRSRWPETKILTFGHLGDCNIHLVISIGKDTEIHSRTIEQVVYERLQPCGGSISAEHGIGLEKKEFLYICRSAEEISLMRTLKKALDPKGILNPNKIFP